jgi:murein hydrolase activator
MRFSLLFIIFFFVFEFNFFSQKRKELEKLRIEKQNEIEKIEKILVKTKTEREYSINRINLLSKRIQIRNELIENLNLEIQEIDSKIDLLEEDVANKSIKLDYLKTEYSKIIYESYFRLKNFNTLLFLLSSENFNQAYRRLYFLKQFTIHRKNLLKRMSEDICEMKISITKLNEEKDNKVNLLDYKEKETKKLSIDENYQKKVLCESKKKESKLLIELKELQEFTKKIEKEIEKVIYNESLAKRYKSKKENEIDVTLTKNFANNKKKLPWPVPNGTVVSVFGEHPHPIFKGIIIKNNGIDISTECNSEIYNIFDGVVSKIFAIKGANFAVIVRHGDYLTVYQNLQEVRIKVGEKIKARQSIGISFCDRSSNLSVVHFEIWQELKRMNPLDWISN